jgi:hypothetical protein
MYREEGIDKTAKIDIEKECQQREIDLEEMITYIVRAGYEVRKGSVVGG